MPYGLIVLIGSFALGVTFVLVTNASGWAKGLVAGLLAVSLVWRYGFFVQAAVGVALSLYFTYLKARF